MSGAINASYWSITTSVSKRVRSLTEALYERGVEQQLRHASASAAALFGGTW